MYLGQFVPIIIESVGAMPKSSVHFHRLITYARLGNHIYT
jgi:hypothetical protein